MNLSDSRSRRSASCARKSRSCMRRPRSCLRPRLRPLPRQAAATMRTRRWMMRDFVLSCDLLS
jgi:hypothetical protein